MCGSKGLGKVIRMLRPVFGGRVRRGPMKTNYSDLKFHLLCRPPSPPIKYTLMLSFPSWGMTIPRAYSARPSAGCFEDDKRKENSVTRGDKFASSWVESFFQPPRCAEQHRTPFIVTRNLSKHTVSSLSPLETCSVLYVRKFYYVIADYPVETKTSDRSTRATRWQRS